MIRYLANKIPQVLVVLFVSSLIAAVLPRLTPGDPAVAIAGPDSSKETIETIRAQLGLDRPFHEQYLDWLGGLFRGDLGHSYLLNRPVGELIASRLESTVELALLAGLLMTVIGLVLGVLAGSPRSRWSRALLDLLTTFYLAVPGFLHGLLMILVLGISLVVLPVSGEVPLSQNPEIGIQYLIMPALALAFGPAAVVARLVQTAMVQVRGEEYIDLAVAKGVPATRITLRHVLRNSVGTAIVALGLRIGDLLAGAIVIEAIFARNGLGSLAVMAVNGHDYQVLQVIIVGAIFIAVVAQLLTEVILAMLDPRIRLGD